MGAQAQAVQKPNAGPPKRRFRNYLLNPRFQLKYTSMVVVVTVIVASVLGFFAYRYSTGQTEAMMVTTLDQPDVDAAVIATMEEEAQAEDRRVLFGIIGGIVLLVIALGMTGILVTHKVVGPAYKMKMLINRVGDGKLTLAGRLRKGDELQDVFEAFANMVESLRESQAREIAELDSAISQAKEAGLDESALTSLVEVRDRMQAALD